MSETFTAAGPRTNRLAHKQPTFNQRLGLWVITHYRACSLLVMALTAFNVFWHLSTTAISSMDEARYGVAASEMLAAHEYLVPTYDGRTEYWNLKPPLGYWLIEASYTVFGRTPWALRLISAVCALGVVALTLNFCSRQFGRRPAVLAGLMVGTCFGFLSNHGARSGDLDAALSLLMTLALIQAPRLRDSPHRLLFGALWACGFLLKSFAILPFALAAMIYLVCSGGERRHWRVWIPPVALFIGIVGGWAILRSIHDGTAEYVIRMTYEDLFLRSTQIIDDGSSSLLGYSAALFVDRFAPWPIFVLFGWIAGGRGARSRTSRGEGRLLLAWALVPLCLFSVARTQHHWYLDPTYPAWAILAAIGLMKVLGSLRSEPARLALVCATALAVVGCELRIIARIGIRDQMPTSQLFLASLSTHPDFDGGPLYATFPLSYAERFWLQVVDGFDVREVSPPPQNTLPALPMSGLILSNPRSGPQARYRPCIDPIIVAQSGDYLLVEGRGPRCLADRRPDTSDPNDD